MPVNPNKRGPRDRKRQHSTQRHEVRYAPKRKVPGTRNKRRK